METRTTAMATGDVTRTDSRYKRIAAAITRHKRRPDALIEILHKVQDAFGYIPVDAMRFIAREMRVPPSRVYGVATFYHFFTLKPKGRHNCVVCTGTACHVRGAQEIVNRIEEELSLRPGQTTPDGVLGVQIARCIGCCGLAPAVVLDDQVLARVKPDQIVPHLKTHIQAAQAIVSGPTA